MLCYDDVVECERLKQHELNNDDVRNVGLLPLELTTYLH